MLNIEFHGLAGRPVKTCVSVQIIRAEPIFIIIYRQIIGPGQQVFGSRRVINPADVDINHDLTIDLMDLSALWDAWLSHDGPSDDWNGSCDISDPPDGIIDVLDLTALVADWLEIFPDPNDLMNAADFNNDRKINILDYSIFSAAWLSDDSPSANWNPACDIAEPADGRVDVLDLEVFTANWLVRVQTPSQWWYGADFDRSLKVDLLDYAAFSAAWQSNDSPTPNWNIACDVAFPRDGVVDARDLAVLAEDWLTTLVDPRERTDVADINNDFRVDQLDYAILSSAWLSDDNPPLNWDSRSDFAPADGRINAFDFSVFAVHWQFTIPDTDQFIFIGGGQFEMGDHYDFMPEAMPTHTVQVDSFYMGKFPITNQQYCEFLNASMASGELKVDAGIVYDIDDTTNSIPYFGTNAVNDHSRIEYAGGVFTVIDKPDHPVVQVNWYGSVAYCNWLSEQQGRQSCYDLSTWQCDFTKSGYRLATEAEWEYAARGGQYVPYYRYFWGDVIDASKANYYIEGGGSPNATTPVGYYDGNQIPAGDVMANAYGLYDMAGNVLEWCNDWYDAGYYSVSPADNPKGPNEGTTRVVRGGSWNNVDEFCLVAFRDKPHMPLERSGSYGFRICIPAPGSDE